MTKRDALRLLENDVDRLLQTTEPARRPALQAEMGRFADLFGRFLQEGEYGRYLVFYREFNMFFSCRGSRTGLE